MSIAPLPFLELRMDDGRRLVLRRSTIVGYAPPLRTPRPGASTNCYVWVVGQDEPFPIRETFETLDLLIRGQEPAQSTPEPTP
jgi:hypothetical protein